MLLMSGDHASKRILSQLLVPAVGRKAMDLGEGLDKGWYFCVRTLFHLTIP